MRCSARSKAYMLLRLLLLSNINRSNQPALMLSSAFIRTRAFKSTKVCQGQSYVCLMNLKTYLNDLRTAQPGDLNGLERANGGNDLVSDLSAHSAMDLHSKKTDSRPLYGTSLTSKGLASAIPQSVCLTTHNCLSKSMHGWRIMGM